MSFGHPELSETRITARGTIGSSIMDVRSKHVTGASTTTGTANSSHIHHNDHHGVEKKNMGVEFRRSLSRGSSGRRLLFPASYFGLESLLFLIGLTASLLILPLILPPLPPPPFLLLLLPIGILVLLMILAFMPSNARDMSHAYV